MSGEEAVGGAAERHEFRSFDHDVAGSVSVVRFVCWGGCPSTNYLTEESARRAHERHQALYTGRGGRRR